MSIPTTETAPRRRLSPRRRWLFRFIAVAGSLSLFPLAEGVLRLVGVGSDLSLAVPAAADPTRPDEKRLQLNPLVDQPYYGARDLAGPEPRDFLAVKPAGLFRVLVLGESTPYGFPHPPELSFPRHLELLLADQNPARLVEVLNAAVVGLNSGSVLDLARRADAVNA
ncbi:MAG: hypothetical protein ACRDD1_15780, partial [Planctomycetia bacterium]